MVVEPELAYLLANRIGDIRSVVPAVEGAQGAGGIHKIDPWAAFAMISGWPGHEVIVEDEDEASGEDDRTRMYHVQRVDGDHWPSVAKVVFSAKMTWEKAAGEVQLLEDHFRQHMDQTMLLGMDLYERVEELISRKRRRENELEASRAALLAEQERALSKQRREAERKESSSDFARAERSVRAGRNFTLTRFGDYSRSRDKKFESSMKKALSVLADPKTIIHALHEETLEGEGRLARVFFEYSDRTKWASDPTHRIEFFAPHSAALEADDLSLQIADPNTAKKTMATRADTL